MNAVEFVKKFGWDAAKKVLNTIENLSDIDKEDFERLVESYELVEKHGGLHGFKTYCNGDFSENDLRVIADVEKCQ